MVNVNIEVGENGFLPKKATDGSAGYDLCASESFTIAPKERKLIPTGVKIGLPCGYEAQIRPRSGLALKKGITVLNTPGTIDSDYRGEIFVILYNTSETEWSFDRGERIAQMVIKETIETNLNLVGHISDDTERGEGGFGHSGTK